jgi:hypothetical protein
MPNGPILLPNDPWSYALNNSSVNVPPILSSDTYLSHVPPYLFPQHQQHGSIPVVSPSLLHNFASIGVTPSRSILSEHERTHSFPFFNQQQNNFNSSTPLSNNGRDSPTSHSPLSPSSPTLKRQLLKQNLKLQNQNRALSLSTPLRTRTIQKQKIHPLASTIRAHSPHSPNRSPHANVTGTAQQQELSPNHTVNSQSPPPLDQFITNNGNATSDLMDIGSVPFPTSVPVRSRTLAGPRLNRQSARARIGVNDLASPPNQAAHDFSFSYPTNMSSRNPNKQQMIDQQLLAAQQLASVQSRAYLSPYINEAENHHITATRSASLPNTLSPPIKSEMLLAAELDLQMTHQLQLQLLQLQQEEQRQQLVNRQVKTTNKN